MSQAPDLREVPELPEEIIQAAPNGNLVLFVGAGTSMLLGLPSWKGMARSQLEFLRKKGALNFSELDQLSHLDPKKQLSIAREIADNNDWDLDLTAGLTGHSESGNIYKQINDIGCVCVTTNYDELLAPRYDDSKDGSATSAIVNRIYEKDKLYAMHLDRPGTVVHLHGSVSDQDKMIVTTKDYLAHYDDSLVQKFLGELFKKKTVLFMGYNLEEAEILEHVLRRGRVTDFAERRRFMLQGFFLSQKPLYEKLHDYYRKSFGVHVIGYVRDQNDYAQQKTILINWRPRITIKPTPLAEDLAVLNEVLDG